MYSGSDDGGSGAVGMSATGGGMQPSTRPTPETRESAGSLVSGPKLVLGIRAVVTHERAER
jgi:hypothetical protein